MSIPGTTPHDLCGSLHGLAPSFSASQGVVYWRGIAMSEAQVRSLLHHFDFARRAEPDSRAARELLTELKAAILAASTERNAA